MKRGPILRESRLVHAAVGATILAPTSVALANPVHDAAAQASGDQSASGLEARVHARKLRYGQPVVMSGRAPSAEAGQAIRLDFALAGSSSWRQIATARISADGSFRLTAPLRTSGSVKVSTAAQPTTLATLGGTAAASGSSTSPQRVVVAAALLTARPSRTVLGARTLDVRGKLLAGTARHRVLLQAWQGRRWVTLAAARTASRGRFDIRYRADAPAREALRVRFRGDRSNAAVATPAGRLSVFRGSVASWYDDAGNTACGFHAYFGVANLSLPCGTRVSFSYGGRTVTGVVDDRGPYVGGREWDLNQNTAAALGFGGVGTVWSSR